MLVGAFLCDAFVIGCDELREVGVVCPLGQPQPLGYYEVIALVYHLLCWWGGGDLPLRE